MFSIHNKKPKELNVLETEVVDSYGSLNEEAECKVGGAWTEPY